MPAKKKAAPKLSEEAKQTVSEVTRNVISQLKTQLDQKIESLRADINSDVQEQIKKVNVPTPDMGGQTGNGGFDVSKIMSGLKDGNLDMGSIGKMMGQANQMPQMDMSKMTVEQQIEMQKMNNQNSLMMMILPELVKTNSGGSPMMAEMMQRFFMENMMEGMNQRKATTQFMLKMVGDPKLMQNYQNSQNNLMTPITDAINKSPAGVNNVNQT